VLDGVSKKVTDTPATLFASLPPVEPPLSSKFATILVESLKSLNAAQVLLLALPTPVILQITKILLVVADGVIESATPADVHELFVCTISVLETPFTTCKTLPGEKLVAPVPPLPVASVPVT